MRVLIKKNYFSSETETQQVTEQMETMLRLSEIHLKRTHNENQSHTLQTEDETHSGEKSGYLDFLNTNNAVIFFLVEV